DSIEVRRQGRITPFESRRRLNYPDRDARDEQTDHPEHEPPYGALDPVQFAQEDAGDTEQEPDHDGAPHPRLVIQFPIPRLAGHLTRPLSRPRPLRDLHRRSPRSPPFAPNGGATSSSEQRVRSPGKADGGAHD